MKTKLFHVLVSVRHAVTYRVRARTPQEAEQIYTDQGAEIEDNIVGADIISTEWIRIKS